MEIPSFNALIQKSIIDHWDMDALTDYKGATLHCYNDEIINTCMCIHGIKSRPVNGLKTQLNPDGLYFV